MTEPRPQAVDGEVWPGRTTVRVRYGETDQMGVVHHKVYLDYFERGRTEMLRAHGLPYAELERGGHLLPVAEAQIKYRSPARYDDLLEVQTRVLRVRGADLQLGYRIVRPEDGRVLALGSTTLACIDRDGRVRRLPAELRALLNELADARKGA